jgi:hypothetical protein
MGLEGVIAELNAKMVDMEIRLSFLERAKGWADEKETTDPYLQPGWPCEVWDDNRAGDPSHVLRYYTGVSDSELRFSEWNDRCANIANTWDHYRPIGTEVDFIEDGVEFYEITANGYAFWYSPDGTCRTIKSVLPAEHWGRRFAVPEWAKEVSE